MQDEARRWLTQAERDLRSAEKLLSIAEYLYTIFLCHLAIEKLLKAILAERGVSPPPKSHNLPYLAKLAGLSVPTRHLEFLGDLSHQGLETRYPDNPDVYNESDARRYLSDTQRTFAWLRQHLISRA